MNNKKLGTQFEKEMVKLLAESGFWVHFISPDNRGAQPFDLIFVKNGFAYVADCKTSANHIFNIDRMEDNQIMAFEKWIHCGNTMPIIFVKHSNMIYPIYYNDLVKEKKIDLLKLERKLGEKHEVHGGK